MSGRRVGITGHPDLGAAGAWVAASLFDLYRSESAVEVLTSLAEGADQIAANVAIARALGLYVLVPSENYEKSFRDGFARADYFRLLSLARGVQTLPYGEPSEEAFFAAGRKVVEQCDVLFAVWDGQPAKGPGGTGDVVEYALAYRRRIVQLDPVRRVVAALPQG